MKILISVVSYSFKATLCLFCILLSSIICANTLESPTAVIAIKANGNNEILNTHAYIDNGAYRDTNLISVAKPDSVTSNGENTFQKTQHIPLVVNGQITNSDRRALKFLSDQLHFLSIDDLCNNSDRSGHLSQCNNTHSESTLIDHADNHSNDMPANSASIPQSRVIDQRFASNDDGSITLKLLVDDSVAHNYPQGIDNLDLVVSYNLDEIEYITNDQISTSSNPFASFSNPNFRAGDILVAQMYFPSAYDTTSELPILEVVFNLKPRVKSTNFKISGVILNTDNLSDLVSESRYYRDPNSDQGIYQSTWDFDGNGKVDALTDGLMLLRYCFGLRGTHVSTLAMASDSTIGPDEAIARIEAALNIADIDNDGEVEALTDGLILLRYLFGLKGEMLTNHALGANANRNSYQTIKAYLDSYLPAK